MKRAYSNNLFETGNTIIPKTMKNLGLLNEYKKNQIFYTWGDIVGKEIGKHIIPQEIKFGVLYVYANSSVWANNFQYLKMEIIEKINEFLGYKFVKDIQFTRLKKKKNENYSAILERKVDLGKYVKKVPITDEELILAEQKVKYIQDEDLKQKIKSVYLKNLQLIKLKKNYGWINCTKCGRLTPKEKPICFNCLREIKEEKEEAIIEIFEEMPWATYQDISQYVDCTMDMVKKQREKLVQTIASKLSPDDFKSIEAMKLVMLYKSISPDKLNECIIKDTLNKLRFDMAFWDNNKKKK